jgi:hypothetical protein
MPLELHQTHLAICKAENQGQLVPIGSLGDNF